MRLSARVFLVLGCFHQLATWMGKSVAWLVVMYSAVITAGEPSTSSAQAIDQAARAGERFISVFHFPLNPLFMNQATLDSLPLAGRIALLMLNSAVVCGVISLLFASTESAPKVDVSTRTGGKYFEFVRGQPLAVLFIVIFFVHARFTFIYFESALGASMAAVTAAMLENKAVEPADREIFDSAVEQLKLYSLPLSLLPGIPETPMEAQRLGSVFYILLNSALCAAVISLLVRMGPSVLFAPMPWLRNLLKSLR